jgi:predicted nucleic acid-binding protein
MSDKFVVDANVVISSLINKGACFSLFLLNSILDRFELIAPEFLFEEVKKHKLKTLKFTKLSEQEFEEAYESLMDGITLIPAEEFLKFLPKAKELAPHPKDAPYIALSLATSCPILSGDKGLLKLSEVNVVSPRKFLDLLLK